MADVLITPADGKIEFKPLGSGQATVSALEGAGDTLNLINTSNVGGAVFNIDGASGSLFSVVDTLDGTLMSVNNSAGLPVFEVFSDDSIVAGRFNQNDFVITSEGKIALGTATPNGTPNAKLTINGDTYGNNFYGTFVGSASSAQSVVWGNVSGKPSTFTPSSHTHAISEVTSLQTTLNAKAPLASPTFTGTPAAPTATGGTNTTQIATTQFVRGEISSLVDSAPGTLDTLNELAAALGDDPSFATTVTNSIATKANTNQTMHIGTTAVAINRGSAALSLTGVNIDGSAASSTTITANGNLTTQQGTGTVGYVGPITGGSTGLFPTSNNANSVLTVSRHSGNYYSQLGFSSNGNLYYRAFNNTAINTTTAWQTIWTSTSLNGGASTIAASNLTVNRALISNGSGKVAVSGVTSTELGYLDNVSSNIQTQLNGKAASSHTHSAATTSVAGFMSATDKSKLDGIAAGAQVNVGTNIAQGTRTTVSVIISSSTGTGATLSVATTSLAGVMSSADKSKLDGIAASANNYSLPAATTSVLGGVKLGNGTTQTVAANSVTSSASRTYAIQINSSGQAVVNVPWVDTKNNLGTGFILDGNEYLADFGTTAGTICQGNDSRLSNARTPTAHTHVAGDVLWQGEADGYLENNISVNSALAAINSAVSSLEVAPPAHTHAASAINSGTFAIARIPTGTTSSTVCIGNDSRLSNARTPTAHTHGNLTNDGKIGSTANLPLITGTDGAVQAGSFGTTANTFCQGNDSRLSNARTPTAHTHAISEVTELQNQLKLRASFSQRNPAGMARFVTIRNSGSVSISVKTTTGYAAVRWWDGSVQVLGSGTPANYVVMSKAVPTSGNWSKSAPKEIFAWSCTSGNANLSGDLTAIYSFGQLLTTADISGLTSLTYVNLHTNKLPSLDVTGMTSLESLICYNNLFTALDVSGLTSLTLLQAGGNQLTSLDVSTLTALTNLNVADSEITSIDVSNLSALQYLYVDRNSLTSLDVSGLTSLLLLYAYNNSLTSLNVSGCTSLVTLIANNNNLTTLNLDNLSSLTGVNVSANDLTELAAASLAPGGYYWYTWWVDYGLNVSNNNLSAAALNDLYTDLASNGSGHILVSSNPGTTGDNPTIATNKGYTIYGS